MKLTKHNLRPRESTQWFTYPVHGVNVSKGELLISHPQLEEPILVSEGEQRTFPSALGIKASAKGDRDAEFLLCRNDFGKHQG